MLRPFDCRPSRASTRWTPRLWNCAPSDRKTAPSSATGIMSAWNGVRLLTASGSGRSVVTRRGYRSSPDNLGEWPSSRSASPVNPSSTSAHGGDRVRRRTPRARGGHVRDDGPGPRCRTRRSAGGRSGSGSSSTHGPMMTRSCTAARRMNPVLWITPPVPEAVEELDEDDESEGCLSIPVSASRSDGPGVRSSARSTSTGIRSRSRPTGGSPASSSTSTTTSTGTCTRTDSCTLRQAGHEGVRKNSWGGPGKSGCPVATTRRAERARRWDGRAPHADDPAWRHGHPRYDVSASRRRSRSGCPGSTRADPPRASPPAPCAPDRPTAGSAHRAPRGELLERRRAVGSADRTGLLVGHRAAGGPGRRARCPTVLPHGRVGRVGLGRIALARAAREGEHDRRGPRHGGARARVLDGSSGSASADVHALSSTLAVTTSATVRTGRIERT